MLNAKKLSQVYLEWVKKSYQFSQLKNGAVRIDVPFLDNFSDEIVMYAVPQSENKIRLTDDGWTLDNLESIGINIYNSPKRKSLLLSQIKAYGIELNDDELFTDVSIEMFPVAKHRLLQAIIFINDMFTLAPKNTSHIFFEDVEIFFESNNIRTTKNMAYIGKSGLTHKYEFAIPGMGSKVPLKLIKIMAGGNNPLFAKSILTDVQQTRPIAEKNTIFYVFLNDVNKKKKLIKINPDIINLFQENSIKTLLYSKRKKYVSELKE